MAQSESTFAERFAFARLMILWRTNRYPAHAEIGEAVGRTGPAVSAWTRAAEPPPDYRIHRPLADYLRVDKDWLIEGVGSAPRPELWVMWIAEQRGPAVASRGNEAPKRIPPAKFKKMTSKDAAAAKKSGKRAG